MTPLDALRRWRPVESPPPSSNELAALPISDQAFDEIYPEWAIDLSEMFWTPLEVAVRSAQLLVHSPGDRVLDIGSGVGKFCFIGAATSGGIFHGIEQRADLVEVAQQIQAQHPWTGEDLEFRVGNMRDQPWDQYQGIYLFNPFFEQTAGPFCQIDQSIGYSRETQALYVEIALAKLATLRPGARVATYFGFGAEFPAGFRKTSYEHFERGPLELWIKDH